MTNTPAKEPARSDYQPLARVTDLRKALVHPQFEQRLKIATPKGCEYDRMKQVMMQAVAKQPELLKCNVMQVLGAMIMVASLGLEPNTPMGHAYLIPFAKRKRQGNQWVVVGYDLQVVIGYPGYIQLAYRSGEVMSLHADVVYEADEFSYEYGSNQHLIHRTSGIRENPKSAYCWVKLRNGGEVFRVMHWPEIMAIRDGSAGYQQALRMFNKEGPNHPAWKKCPWVAFEHQMAAKTPIRAMRNFMPMTISMARAAQLEDIQDQGSAAFASIFDLSSDELHAGVFTVDQVQDAQIVDPEPKKETPKPQAERIHDVKTAPAENPVISAENMIPLMAPNGQEIGNYASAEDWTTEFANYAEMHGFDPMRDANIDMFDLAMTDPECAKVLTNIPADEPAAADDGNHSEPSKKELPKTRGGKIDGNAVLEMLGADLSQAPHAGAVQAVVDDWSATIPDLGPTLRMKCAQLIQKRTKEVTS